MLKRVKIHNFKSFKDFEINLNRINCIIAPNNAGKSNLINAFRFLYYAVVSPDKAIEEFGGFDNIRNIFLNEDKIVFEYEFQKDVISYNFTARYSLNLQNLNIIHRITFLKNDEWFSEIFIDGKATYEKCDIKDFESIDKLYEYVKSKRKYKFNAKLKLYSNPVKEMEYDITSTNKTVENFLNQNPYCLKKLPDKDFFYTYNFYPEKIKSTFKGGNKLLEDGTNLVEVLTFIYENKKDIFDNISSSLTGIVEEVEDIKIDKDLIDRNILLLKEKSKFLPFNITSDGTINLLALITALYEPVNKFMISIDELEKHLHLKAVDYVLDIIKNFRLQVCFTTQSGEIMNEMKKDEIIFLYRDYEGFTKSIRADQIAGIDRKLKRFKDISTMIKYDILGYLGDYDEKR